MQRLQLFGALTRREGVRTGVISLYTAEEGRWIPAPVPLPATAFLMVPALAALVLASRRKRSRPA